MSLENQSKETLSSLLSTYGDGNLGKLLADLQGAIKTYQDIEQQGWQQSQESADPAHTGGSAGFDVKQEEFLKQQKLINLQSQRDNFMQKLVGDFQNNTNRFISSLKLDASKNYVSDLQDTLTNVNQNKLGAINSDIMTYSRLASINIEKYNYVSRVNKYFAVTIVFLAVFLILCIIAYLKLAWLPNSVMYVLLGLSFLIYLSVISLKLYIDGRQYRMLQIEKDFNVPLEDNTSASAGTCQNCCNSS
jgi:hypothetical protein